MSSLHQLNHCREAGLTGTCQTERTIDVASPMETLPDESPHKSETTICITTSPECPIFEKPLPLAFSGPIQHLFLDLSELTLLGEIEMLAKRLRYYARATGVSIAMSKASSDASFDQRFHQYARHLDRSVILAPISSPQWFNVVKRHRSY